ncbi:MAG: response regulator transcription factor [Elusimicrobiales bacterium]|nr:response regulator transcription factor [Elusimicrobiales bacterium]
MTIPGKIRVLIADDHSVVIEGLKAVLKKTAPDIVVSGEARDGRRALDLARRSPADVYVFDISMPVLNGLEAMSLLLRSDSDARVIMLSMHDDRPTVEKALRAGAKGYLVKESAAGEIARALRVVHRGKRYLSPSITDLLESSAPSCPRSGGKVRDWSLLTASEIAIVRYIAEGLGNKQIAVRLSISCSTVQVHRRNIARKLDIHKQTDLVRYAIREGLSKP